MSSSMIVEEYTIKFNSAGKPPQMSGKEEAVMQLLSDGKPHSLDELAALGLTDNERKALLRALCDEEKIRIVDGKIMK